ncbi:MAG: AgmX/PglI C-terminal domain-containing protein [Archangium sp.]
MLHAVVLLALLQHPPLGQVPPKKETRAGTLDRELIAKTVNQHVSEWARCFDHPAPSGSAKASIEWTIKEDGKVEGAHAAQADENFAAFQQCLVATITSWTFPKPVGGPVIVRFPFMP